MPMSEPLARLPAAGQAGQVTEVVGGPTRPGHEAAALAVLLPAADVLALGAALEAAGRMDLRAAAYSAAVMVILAFRGMLRIRLCLRVSDEVGRILTAVALPLLFLLPWLSVGFSWRIAMWSAAFLVVVRALVYAALRAARRRGLLIQPTLVVGAGEMGVLIANLLREHTELGLRPLGFLDACPPPDEELPLPLIGAAADLPSMIGRLGVRRVIVCFPVDRDRDLALVLRACRSLPADIWLVPRLQELGAAIPRTYMDEIWGIPLILLRRDFAAGRLAKRCFDVLGAALLLCILWPVLLVLAAVIRLRYGRPAIFRQVRVTGLGLTSSILKLRSVEMHSDPDTCWQVPQDWCTPLGRWLRASHVDELPQLVNVLRGEMSLVGPRPERPHFAERFGSEIPRYHDRNRMPAGLTGWAQVNGLHGDTSMQDRVRFDNQYIEYWSPWLDVVILLRTATEMVRSHKGGRR
jgi:exopolysaccharide biosynthesis polyprenyl glycosylphosphotransferase